MSILIKGYEDNDNLSEVLKLSKRVALRLNVRCSKSENNTRKKQLS